MSRGARGIVPAACERDGLGERDGRARECQRRRRLLLHLEHGVGRHGGEGTVPGVTGRVKRG